MLWILALAALAGAFLLLRAGRKAAGVLVGIVALAIFVAVVALTVLGRAYRIPSEAMLPTMEVGDRVIADNRGASDDSRFWGPVPEEWVRGRVVARYWPPSRAGGV